MKLKSLALCVSVILVGVPLWAAAPLKPSLNFTLSNPTHIPGATLQPGSYVMGVVNRLSDRVILRVDGASGNVHSTFIGVENRKMMKPATPGVVRWAKSSDGTDYLKGLSFAGTPGVVEFVYPKAEAVALATLNPEKVPAIDPASEGKPADNTLSKDDMQLVTLWLLSLQEVGPGDKTSSIQAERYERTASVSQKPVIADLPHTASNLPWIGMLGVGCLLGAVVLGLFRRRNLSAVHL